MWYDVEVSNIVIVWYHPLKCFVLHNATLSGSDSDGIVKVGSDLSQTPVMVADSKTVVVGGIA